MPISDLARAGEQSQPVGLTARPRCGDCQCYLAPADRPGADAVAAAAAGLNRGECFRYPATVRKYPDDHCFEFLAKPGDPHAR